MHLDGHTKETPSRCKSEEYKKKPIIVCGDLNVAYMPIDLAHPESNHNSAGFSDQERNKFGELLESGFTDSYRHLHPNEQKYSWWSYRMKARERNVGWRIDYFLISDELKDNIKSAEIHNDIYGSDHCPISLDIDI